jgi:membrane protein YqaA with SNARE-associated domain
MESELGYLALFGASFLAATILPFSSEVMVTAMLVARFDPVYTLTVATAGNWLGGLSSYWIGWLGNWQWIEKYLRIKASLLEKIQSKIQGKEGWIALFCWVPFVGDPLAVALGLLKTRFLSTAFWMLVGKAARYVVWGYLTLRVMEAVQ